MDCCIWEVEKGGMWMGTYLLRKLSTYVLKLKCSICGSNIVSTIENMSLFVIATFWIMSHLKCPIRYDIFEDCSLLKGFI